MPSCQAIQFKCAEEKQREAKLSVKKYLCRASDVRGEQHRALIQTDRLVLQIISLWLKQAHFRVL